MSICHSVCLCLSPVTTSARVTLPDLSRHCTSARGASAVTDAGRPTYRDCRVRGPYGLSMHRRWVADP